jgi:hypothetical protein
MNNDNETARAHAQLTLARKGKAFSYELGTIVTNDADTNGKIVAFVNVRESEGHAGDACLAIIDGRNVRIVRI